MTSLNSKKSALPITEADKKTAKRTLRQEGLAILLEDGDNKGKSALLLAS